MRDNVIHIREPIWLNKKPCVGIAEYRVSRGNPWTYFDIEYTYKSGAMEGKRVHPGIFRIDTAKVFTYPVKHVRNNVVLRLIPLSDCIRDDIFIGGY